MMTNLNKRKKTTGNFGFFTAFLFFLYFQNAPAIEDVISIDSRVDKSTIHIGDLIKYTVEVTRSPGIDIEIPELGANLGAFEIRGYSVHDPIKVRDNVLDKVVYTISTFDTGDFVIPALVFYYTLPGDSAKNTLKTQPIDIKVESLKPSEAGDIRDIKMPLELPRDYRELIIWTSVGVAALILIAVSIYIWRRKKAGKGILPVKVEPPRPAHEIALEELRALQASSLLHDGQIKEFYIQMSEIIRRYIEGRYFIVALELTTFEVIEELKNSEVEEENVDLIHEFLEVCDLVKFAKYLPPANETVTILNRAFELVERTKLIYDIPIESDSESSFRNEKTVVPARATSSQSVTENIEEAK